MRISKGALLVVLAFVAPVIVELRTVLAWFGVDLAVFESIVLSLVIVAIIVGWAIWPEKDGGESTDTRASNGN
ncbi:hypothetical protein [Natronolimnohabitans innermongolicus]|uniref:CbaC protein n=1 Tax=Natronolimnohabitans innermongolicus JCM 12255 TaxID=1227499 RepID=L9X5H6_9EURY|nr:hypothetical protein [Natronolimnohabitans innermongolicus]ELY57019.1 CbaC protein [Natronolimnohabitans innermongolicus JCM 12255]